MLKRFYWLCFFVLCGLCVGTPVQAEEDLNSLLQVHSSSKSAKPKVLRKAQAKERLTELKRLLVEEKKQKHQQRLGKELEKLESLLPNTKSPSRESNT